MGIPNFRFAKNNQPVGLSRRFQRKRSGIKQVGRVVLADRKVRLLGRLTVQTDIRLYGVQGQVSAITDYCIREREPKTKWQPFVFRFPWIDLTPNRRPFRQPNLPNAPPDNRDPFQTRAYKLR